MTASTREIELKLELRSEDLPRLRRHPGIRALTQGRARTRTLRSVYFDSPDLALSRQGIGLRVRRVGGHFVQTVKTRGASTAGLFERGEFECAVSGPRPELERVSEPNLRALLEAEAANAPLEAVLETEFRRTRRRLLSGDAEILFDLDVGEVRAQGATAPICELELELVRGEPKALFELALELSEQVTLRPASRGKSDIGTELLTGERPTARKARKVKLPPDASTEEIWVSIVERCLEQILANERPAREGVDPEGVHQLRVGARRLRSALSLFAPLLPRVQTAPLADELRWLARELGPARELDVFLNETLEPLFRRYSDDAALKRLRDGARELRARGYDRARRAIDSPRYPRLVLKLGRFVAARTWRDALDPADLEQLRGPARVTGRRLLERRLRKAWQLGSRLTDLSSHERHRLRVQLKKLRYASEFFRCVYSGEREQADRFVDPLEDLQDLLGALNDYADTERVLDLVLGSMGTDAGPEQRGAAGFVAGWTARRAEKVEDELTHAWRAFAEAPPFWQAETPAD